MNTLPHPTRGMEPGIAIRADRLLETDERRTQRAAHRILTSSRDKPNVARSPEATPGTRLSGTRAHRIRTQAAVTESAAAQCPWP